MFEFIREYSRELVVSVVFVVLIVGIRFTLMRRFLHQETLLGEVRRRLVVNTRNITLTILVLGMVVIWAQELQAVALSMFAIAAALVIATKELIMCLSGAFVRARMFSVGDRIIVGDQRGDVIDKSMLTTRLLEIGPGLDAHQYTGRVLVVPNSRLFTEAVVNESALGEYLTHVVRIPLARTDDWQRAREILLEVGRDACADYEKKAADWLRRVEADFGHYAPSAEPRVSIAIPEPTRVDLLLRVPVPKGRKQRVEQKILNDFLAAFPATPPATTPDRADGTAVAPPDTTAPEPGTSG